MEDFKSIIDPDGASPVNDTLHCLAWLVRGLTYSADSVMKSIGSGEIPTSDDADALAFYFDNVGVWISKELTSAADRLENEGENVDEGSR